MSTVEAIKPTRKCESCKTDILLEDVMLLHWCDQEAVTSEAVTSANEIVAAEQALLCINCTYTCDRC